MVRYPGRGEIRNPVLEQISGPYRIDRQQTADSGGRDRNDMLGLPHRFLTEGLPGIGGRIKGCPEDFVVEEVPLYHPCGQGEHVYLWIEKTDLSTLEAIRRLAQAFDRSPDDLGYAGMKDRKAVTRQYVSVGGVSLEGAREVRVPQVRILSAERHTNKLRLGHLRGNRFEIRVRGIGEDGEGEDGTPDVESRTVAILAQLVARGIPNYFGPQRFGARGDAQWVGKAFLVHDDAAGIGRILGCPASSEYNPDVVLARYLFMQKRWRTAMETFPPYYRTERDLLRYLLRAGENWRGARRRIEARVLKLYFTAYQSYLFNRCLEARLESMGGDPGRLVRGDLAFLHPKGALFGVEDPDAVRERAERFEISPSGPMFGKKMPIPEPGLQADIERECLAREKVLPTLFHQLEPRYHLSGGRRALRVPVADLDHRFEDGDLLLRFFLPRGAYATTLLRELMKNEVGLPGFEETYDPPAQAG